MLHRQHNDPKLDAFRFVWPVLMVCCFAIVGALVVGLRAWRFSNFPHSIATIQEVWDQKVKVSGRGGEPLFEPHYDFWHDCFRAPAKGHYAFLRADGEAWKA